MSAAASLFRLLHAACLLAGPARAFRAKKPDAGARLGQALTRLGPAYIKLGQMLATRPDIVGSAVAGALEHLQDRLPGIEIKRFRKPTFTKPAPEDLRRRIAQEADFVIEALAD